MYNYDVLFDYILCLKKIYSLENMYIIGGDFYLNKLKDEFKELIFFENDECKLKQLKKYDNIKIIKKILYSAKNKKIYYYFTNNCSLNGTINPNLLKKKWRNILVKKKEIVFTHTLDEFIDIRDNTSNILFINYLNALDILKGANKSLNHFDVIILKTINDNDLGILDKNDINNFLFTKNYIEFSDIKKFNSFLDINIYIKNYKQKYINCCHQNSFKLKNKEETSDLNSKENSLLSNIDILLKLNKSIYNTILESKAEIKNYIANKSILTAKQIESFWSINNYFITKDKPINFHGWPISPDIALFLLNRIIENDYDLILEFGSGTSTLLFAKAIKTKYENRNRIPKIITIEHDSNYLKNIKHILDINKLGNYVELFLSPLKELIYYNNKYIYYDCEDIFEQIGKNSYNKVLILVDGPPGATCKNARLPAIKFILSYINSIEIDIVLDDAYRIDEKNTINEWEKILTKNKIKHESKFIKNEKGMYFLKLQKEKKNEFK